MSKTKQGVWVPVEDRLPTQADSDAQHCVIGWHKYNGVMVTGWHQFKVGGMYTHWMPVPKSPFLIEQPEGA